MPYYRNINLLYLHIPKTGGSSIEDFLFENFKVVKNISSLYSHNEVIKGIPYSLQHCTFNDILNLNKFLKMPFKKLKIMCSVRNPYDRFISFLFFKDLIKKNETPEKIELLMKNILKEENYKKYDNHILPQHIFILNKNEILKCVKIVKNETLKKDMCNIGFDKFNFYINITNPYDYKNKDDIKYLKYFNQNSLNFINEFYKNDFIIFNYNKINNLNNFYKSLENIIEITNEEERHFVSMKKSQDCLDEDKIQEITEITEITNEEERHFVSMKNFQDFLDEDKIQEITEITEITNEEERHFVSMDEDKIQEITKQEEANREDIGKRHFVSMDLKKSVEMANIRRRNILKLKYIATQQRNMKQQQQQQQQKQKQQQTQQEKNKNLNKKIKFGLIFIKK